MKLQAFIIVATVLISVVSTPAQAGVVGEIIKQTSKAAAKVVTGKAVESGTKNAAKQMVKKLGKEVMEASASKSTATVIAKGGIGDDVANFAWRNKGVIVGGTVLATAAANGDGVLAAGTEVFNTGINATAKHVVAPVTIAAIDETRAWAPWIVIVGICLAGACYKYRIWKREPSRP